jgi:hypothetical protein
VHQDQFRLQLFRELDDLAAWVAESHSEIDFVEWARGETISKDALCMLLASIAVLRFPSHSVLDKQAL